MIIRTTRVLAVIGSLLAVACGGDDAESGSSSGAVNSGGAGQAGAGGSAGQSGAGGGAGLAGAAGTGGGGGNGCTAMLGCCTEVQDCKAAPAVGPCWDGSSPGSLACESGACTWKANSCPTMPTDSVLDHLSAACSACTKTMKGASASVPLCETALMNCTGAVCHPLFTCIESEGAKHPAATSADCDARACKKTAFPWPQGGALLECLSEKCGAECKLTPGLSTATCE